MSRIIKAGSLDPSRLGLCHLAKAPDETPPTGPFAKGGHAEAERAERLAREMKTDAARIILEAEQTAARIVAGAEAEATAIKSRAEEEGYARGMEEGHRAALEQIQPVIQAFEAAVEEAASVREKAVSRMEEDVLKLAVAIAEKIIRREVDESIYTTTRLIGEALEHVDAATEALVRVNPREYLELQERWNQIVSQFTRLEKIRLVPDEQVEAGGCIVETDFGTVDAGLETRLVEVSSALLEVMRRG